MFIKHPGVSAQAFADLTVWLASEANFLDADALHTGEMFVQRDGSKCTKVRFARLVRSEERAGAMNITLDVILDYHVESLNLRPTRLRQKVPMKYYNELISLLQA